MLVALVGATGNIGPRLVREFSNRGHQVTAVTSHPDDVLDLPGRHTRRGRRERPHDPARLLAGQDVVVSSTQFKKTDHDALSESVTASDVPRYLFNGGSGTLLAPGTSRIMDTRGSRQHSRGRLRPRRAFFERLQQETRTELDVLVASSGIRPGGRTGIFRVARYELLVRPDGPPEISFEDYAIAIVDEIENPTLVRQRFTVAG